MKTISDQHPPSLGVFFATEMWERYGFYVVQTLLALYLALYFKWPDEQIYALVGSFTALTYISPVIGGWIADHLIGQKRSTLLGAVFLFMSYLLLSIHASEHTLTIALAGIAVGTGLLKSNISSLLGNEYPINSPHRESGFTIFYMGITSGIILGTTVPSSLNAHFGWSLSFTSAAIGILIAITIFTWGIRHYSIHDYHPYQYHFKKTAGAGCMIMAMSLMAYLILTNPTLANSAFIITVILSLAYLFYSAYREPPQQAKQTLVIALLCIISVMFWAFYFQMFLSFTLFIIRVVKPTLANVAFPPPYYVCAQSIGMILIGVLFAKKKGSLQIRQQGIRSGNKFLLAMSIMLLAYGLIALAAHQAPNTNTLLLPLTILPTYLLISLAELLLSPVGLCAVTLLACRKRVSTMMGIFLVSLGIGGFLSGKLASLTAIGANETSPLIQKAHYATSFSQLFMMLCAATILSAGLNYAIKYLMKSTKEQF